MLYFSIFKRRLLVYHGVGKCTVLAGVITTLSPGYLSGNFGEAVYSQLACFKPFIGLGNLQHTLPLLAYVRYFIGMDSVFYPFKGSVALSLATKDKC